jgi:hypothetical protein
MAPRLAPINTESVPRIMPPPRPKAEAKTKPAPRVRIDAGINSTAEIKYTKYSTTYKVQMLVTMPPADATNLEHQLFLHMHVPTMNKNMPPIGWSSIHSRNSLIPTLRYPFVVVSIMMKRTKPSKRRPTTSLPWIIIQPVHTPPGQ